MTASDSALLQRLSLLSGAPGPVCPPVDGWMGSPTTVGPPRYPPCGPAVRRLRYEPGAPKHSSRQAQCPGKTGSTPPASFNGAATPSCRWWCSCSSAQASDIRGGQRRSSRPRRRIPPAGATAGRGREYLTGLRSVLAGLVPPSRSIRLSLSVHVLFADRCVTCMRSRHPPCTTTWT